MNRQTVFTTLCAVFGALIVGGISGQSLEKPAAAQPAPNDAQIASLQREIQEVRALAQRSQVLATAYQLEGAGFHGIDVTLQAGNLPPANTLGVVRRSRIAAQHTPWPNDLQETATLLIDQMMLLESAVRDEDAAAAAGPAVEVHNLAHRLSDGVYTMYASAAGVPAAAHGH